MKKQNLKPAVLIFSGDRTDGFGYPNQLARSNIRQYLEGNCIPFKEVIGRYQGERETSFIVPALYEQNVEILTRNYLQDVYLYLHPDRAVDQVNVQTGKRTPLGQWTHAPRRPTGDYTYDNPNYYEVT